MSSLLDDTLARIKGLKPEDRALLVKETMQATSGLKWIPNPGPQTQAFYSPADLLLYGGQGGGGKSDLLAGLAYTASKRALIIRRHYTDLGALIERTLEIHGGRDGFNGSPPPKLRHSNGRLIEFGACAHLGDEQHWQGQPHDTLEIDEAVQLLEAQVRFLMGWVRSADETQRKRTILATNPPVTAEGQWIVGMFRPWLDLTHPNPAKHGELRWFITDPDGKDLEVGGESDIREWDGKQYVPKSRTFIPAALKDNPFLVNTGYQATLDALPEPLRSAVRDGNFMAARKDAANQVIPTAWIIAAQKRWTQSPPQNVPMCAMAADASGGGDDPLVIASRHDGWFAKPISIPGKDIPSDRIGGFSAGVVVSHRRDEAPVVVDRGGGYGDSLFEHLKGNGVDVFAYKGAEKSLERTRDRKLGFFNKRSATIWKFREALDPEQEGGSPVALPDSPSLVADLTAPTFEITPNGIKVESKEDVCARLGRSTDEGDAVVMCWSQGLKAHNIQGGWLGAHNPRNRTPTVVLSKPKTRR